MMLPRTAANRCPPRLKQHCAKENDNSMWMVMTTVVIDNPNNENFMLIHS